MGSQYELIIFDWDGTLMDSERKIVTCFQKACEDIHIRPPSAEQVKEIIGLDLAGAMERLLPDAHAEQRSQVVERYREHFLHLDDTDMLFFPAVMEGLSQLQQWGYGLAVATGKARRGLNRLLDQWSLHEHFVSTRCADEAFSKPHPKMLHDIMDMTGKQPGQAVMVGDTVFDMEMAQHAGMDRMAVGYGVHRLERLQAYEPVSSFYDFQQLLDWFKR